MTMSLFSAQISSLFPAIILAVSLISCGGGGNSDNSSNDTTNTGNTEQRTGTVGILLTDKPADPSLFLSINATIERVELIDTQDGEPVTLYTEAPQIIDLLRLKNESIAFTYNDNVPVGDYCKIRLILSDLELVLIDDTPNDLTDNETYHPDLPGNGKLDLVSRDCFTVDEGNVITVQIDLDGGNSIHIVENNQGYNFRPVVFVDVLSEGFKSKLVRLEGEISEVMPDENTLLLCGALPVHESDSSECVEVHLSDDTAFFDNLNYSGGQPRSLDELLVEDMIGEQIVVVGRPDHHVTPHMGIDVDIPHGHLPPPGECRLWELDDEPGQQSPPGDCEALEAEETDDAILVDHDGVVRDRYQPLMEIDALVVELGEFLQLEGNVASNADNSSGFSMTVTSGEGVEVGVDLDAVLLGGEVNLNGTRIVSKSGDIFDYQAIVQARQIQVDGVLDSTTAGTALNAALVIVDINDEESGQVTGTVLSVGTDSIVISPTAETVCGIASSDLLVTLEEDAEFITIVITDTVSEITQGGTLEAGQSVGINGSCSADGYLAESVAIVDDQRVL
jgi:hypothetical protein